MMLLLALFLVFQVILNQGLVSANAVVDWTPHAIGNQLAFPNHSEPETTVFIEIKSPDGALYKVKCELYKDENPKADIFKQNGVLLDSLILDAIEANPCDESNIKNYIVPRNPRKRTDGKQEDVMVYLWSNKRPKCVERTYKVTELFLMANVQKQGYPRVPCLDEIKEYIEKFNGQKPGGVIGVSPVGRYDIFDFDPNVVSHGPSKTVILPTIDLKGKSFKLLCRTDTLSSVDPKLNSNTITTGFIVHEENEDIVLEKFKMTECNADYINVNRQTMIDLNQYKIVFKDVTGTCYEREYDFFSSYFFLYFNQITIYRGYPEEVDCPRSFVGDIGLNAWRPLYKRIFKWFFTKPTPYMTEYNPTES